MAGRKYKNDLSDVVGIIIEQENKGKTISIEVVKKAVIDLYDRYENIPNDSRKFIEAIYEKDKVAYKVMSDDIKYDVVSSGKQAMKDLIFIRKGQEIEIQGNLEGEMIQAEKSKISIST